LKPEVSGIHPVYDTNERSPPLPSVSSTVSFDSFLQDIARVAPRSGPPRRASGTVIAGRYELKRELGRGAHGVVWEATDSLSAGEVAVKLLSLASRSHAARVRTEIASLRRLRIPGIAHLVDEGTDGALTFLVMRRVRGRRFPGVSVPCSFEDLRVPTELLLATLAQVHDAGIVHRDLKPANVLVDERERPIVLDFGLSMLSTFDGQDEHGMILGTPAYLAPEQVHGLDVGPRADLFAVGVMLFQALTGRLPHEGEDLKTLVAQKASGAPSIGELVRDLPRHVAGLVDSLLAVDPQERPASAAAALAMLRSTGIASTAVAPTSDAAGLRPSEPGGTAPPQTLSDAELGEHFVGPDRLSWVKSDAARILRQLTGGDPRRVRDTLDGWRRGGFCRAVSESPLRLAIDRETLDELDSDLWNDAAPTQPGFTVRALQIAQSLAEEGRLGNAIAVLHEAVAELRRSPVDPNVELLDRVRTLWLDIALAEGTPHSLDRVLYELTRAPDSPTQRHLEPLARAALSVFAWNDRAFELALELPAFDSSSLELRRLGVLVLAARRASLANEERVVEKIVADVSSSSSERLRASAAGWLGRLRYRQGRYAVAADLHLEAASRAGWATERIAYKLHAASAMLEAHDVEPARALAKEALDEARVCRNSYLAGRAEWIVRAASYRLGRDLGVDHELLLAARTAAAPEVYGMIALVEATHAYRTRDPIAPTLALEVYRWWADAGEPIASLLSGGIAVARDAEMPDADRERLLAAAWACEVPGIGIQAAAMLCEGGAPAPPRAVRERLLATVPTQHYGRRLDVLSVDECLTLFAGVRLPLGTTTE
jgi:hypothetical protein